MGKSPPIICEKCRRRRLSQTYDKGHRWCKHCRAEAFAKVSGISADERRLRRTVYDFTATRALLDVLESGEASEVKYKTATKYRFDYTRTQKKAKCKTLKRNG